MLISEWTCSIFGLHTALHKRREDVREGTQISIRTGRLPVPFLPAATSAFQATSDNVV